MLRFNLLKDGKTYEENPEPNGYVIDLQKFDNLINVALKNGLITIEETEIKGIDEKNFEL